MNRKRIRDLVKSILEDYKINTAPVDIEKICTELGISIKRGSFEDDLSGFAFNRRGTQVIGVNAEDGPLRQRFTIAHELGHLKLDPRDSINYDLHFAMHLRDTTSSLGTKLKEVEANFFAAEILMPAAFLRKDIARLAKSGIDFEDDNIVSKLAKEYQVSQHAMSVRLASLHYV